jgi:flagellar basal body-associated protein FliL
MTDNYGAPVSTEPTYEEQPPKKSNTTLIVVIIVVLLLCCCCLVFFGFIGFMWNFGDQIFQTSSTQLVQLLLT